MDLWVVDCMCSRTTDSPAGVCMYVCVCVCAEGGVVRTSTGTSRPGAPAGNKPASQTSKGTSRPRKPARTHGCRKTRGCLLERAMDHGPRRRHHTVIDEKPELREGLAGAILL
eukprot:355781-Chlamydomonas_euryale.AAC.2